MYIFKEGLYSDTNIYGSIKKNSLKLKKDPIIIDGSINPKVLRELRRQRSERYDKIAQQAYERDSQALKKFGEELDKRSLRGKLAGFSKDAINSVKNASIKAGRNAKAGMLHGMRRGALSLSESADKLSKSLLRIRH